MTVSVPNNSRNYLAYYADIRLFLRWRWTCFLKFFKEIRWYKTSNTTNFTLGNRRTWIKKKIKIKPWRIKVHFLSQINTQDSRAEFNMWITYSVKPVFVHFSIDVQNVARAKLQFNLNGQNIVNIILLQILTAAKVYLFSILGAASPSVLFGYFCFRFYFIFGLIARTVKVQ